MLEKINTTSSKEKWCLSVCGFDPTSGAGLLADHRVFCRKNIFHAALLTANTIQNSCQLACVLPVEITVLQQQCRLLLEDFGPPSVIKLSLLPSALHLDWFINFYHTLPAHTVLIFDPIVRSGSGGILSSVFSDPSQLSRLFEVCDIVTPNYEEFLSLFSDIKGLHKAMHQGHFATLISSMQADPSTLKSEQIAHQLFLRHTNGQIAAAKTFYSQRIAGVYHGSGCKLASHLAVGVLSGLDWTENVAQAIACTQHDIQHSTWLAACQYIAN